MPNGGALGTYNSFHKRELTRKENRTKSSLVMIPDFVYSKEATYVLLQCMRACTIEHKISLNLTAEE
jgi:hypothetical protein